MHLCSKNSGHQKILLQNINQYYGISCHTKSESVISDCSLPDTLRRIHQVCIQLVYHTSDFSSHRAQYKLQVGR